MSESISNQVRKAVEGALNPDATVENDTCPCLDDWIKTFGNCFDLNKGITLSPNGAAALYHTLLVSRIRVAKLVDERDAVINQKGSDHDDTQATLHRDPR